MVRVYDSNVVLAPVLHPGKPLAKWVNETKDEDAILLPPGVVAEALGRVLHQGVSSALSWLKREADRRMVDSDMAARQLLEDAARLDPDNTGWVPFTAPLISRRLAAGTPADSLRRPRPHLLEEIFRDAQAHVRAPLSGSDIHEIVQLPNETRSTYDLARTRASRHFERAQSEDLAIFAQTLVLAGCHQTPPEPFLIVTEDVDFVQAAKHALKDPRLLFDVEHVDILRVPPKGRTIRSREGNRYQLPPLLTPGAK